MASAFCFPEHRGLFGYGLPTFAWWLFLLLSALVTLLIEGFPGPYPFGLRSLAIFAVLYTAFVTMLYRAMKKRLAAE